MPEALLLSWEFELEKKRKLPHFASSSDYAFWDKSYHVKYSNFANGAHFKIMLFQTNNVEVAWYRSLFQQNSRHHLNPKDEIQTNAWIRIAIRKFLKRLLSEKKVTNKQVIDLAFQSISSGKLKLLLVHTYQRWTFTCIGAPTFCC